MVVEVVSAAVALLAVAFAARCYLELYRWARQCQNARIAIAYNRRVQISAPLVDWIGWANQLAGDDASRGRMIFQRNKVSVSILRPRPVGKTHATILRLRRRWRERKRAPRDTGRLAPGTKSIKVGANTNAEQA